MNHTLSPKVLLLRLLLLVGGSFLLATATIQKTQAQASLANVTVDLGSLEEVELTPTNAFNFRILNNSGAPRQIKLTGTLHYKASPYRFTWAVETTLATGINNFSAERLNHPALSFSDAAFRELFMNYGKLPQGTYEYCIRVAPKQLGPESPIADGQLECTYKTVEDLFLINLSEPEDKAKIYEHYPQFSWVVNYPFASQLQYRIRVAEQKKGQSARSAINRNNPVWRDDRIPSTTATYPLTGRPLQVGQPYAWTVDAYFKSILLGGAEAWTFTIIEDSELVAVPREQAYYEFQKHDGDTRLYAVGTLKLKYLTEQQGDSLQLTLLDSKGELLALKQPALSQILGDNKIDLDFTEAQPLKHKKQYSLRLRSGDGHNYIVPFTYINPLYLK